MKRLTVMAAGLGFRDLERRGKLRMAGLEFGEGESAFPAVTCVAQANARTGKLPREHGMTSNGHFSRELMKPMFWEQSARLVRGERVWAGARERGETVGLYFWQQAMGEAADYILTPAPIHKHGGGMTMRNYTQPAEAGEALHRALGTFPLHRYWGPLAGAKVGRAVIANFRKMCEIAEPDRAYLYLPTLDYEAQRHGPGSAAAGAALEEFERQLEGLADFAQSRGAELRVSGDYAIGDVPLGPVFPNATLRKAGLFRVRPVAGRAYPDIAGSAAFAMCDHEIAHVYVQDAGDVGRVRDAMEATGDYEAVEERGGQDWAHPGAGELLLTAKAGAWCAYPWWARAGEAPDWATHVDIHNKPGYDPCELFFGRLLPPGTSQDWRRVKGSHGRRSPVAVSRLRRGDECTAYR